jgi:ribosomal protein L1
MDKNIFNTDDAGQQFGGTGDGEDKKGSSVSSLGPLETMKKHFENRRGDASKEAAKERAAASSELATRNAQSMNSLIGKVRANNAEVASNVAKAHATISSLVNNAAGGGNSSETASKIMQGTASTLAQPSFSRT